MFQKTIRMLAILTACILGASYAQAAPKPDYRPGAVLVKLRSEAASEGVRAFIGAERKRSYGALGIERLKLPPGLSVEAAVEALRTHPDVEFAEPDYRLSVRAAPNDPAYSNQWGLNNSGQTVNSHTGTADSDIDAPEAWETSTGSPGVIVAVLDTGVDYNHPDLSANMWVNTGEVAGDGLDNDANGYVDDIYGYDFAADDADPMDDADHGTHVAGIIAARGNDAYGLTGVMWNARIMALKFMHSDGGGYVSDAVDGILYASAKGANVINCSFGGYSPSATLQAAIEATNALFVCASGNEAYDTDLVPHYPSAYSSANIIAVAATGQSDDLLPYSNFGAASVDLAAPGFNILSSIPAPRTTLYTDDFANGTLDSWITGGTASWVETNGSLTDGSGDYANYADSYAYLPLSLQGYAGCSLDYVFTLRTEEGYDYFYVEASTDASAWNTLAEYTGTEISATGAVSLPRYDSGPVYVRFRLASDESIVDDGVSIDSVAIACASTAYDGSREYAYYEGTSMAAPFVSGAVGLIIANDRALSPASVKDAVLSAVDEVPSLAGRMVSGGRLNAAKAFFAPPEGLAAAASSSSSIVLTWTDTSTGESGFEIERKTTGSFSKVADAAADSTSYTDTGLRSETAYTYRVRAVSGTKGESRYSGEAAATTESSGGSDDGGGGGGCFIATAAYGSPLAAEVGTLRAFRDTRLMTSPTGRAFVRLYYRLSPPVARAVASSPALRAGVRTALRPAIFGLRHPVAAGALALAALMAAFAAAFFRMKKRVPFGSGPSSGFTLLEVLVVVFILGMLAALVAPRFIGRADDAKVTEAKVQIRNIETALKLFKLDSGFYPSTEQGLEALVQKPESGREPSHYRTGGYLDQERVPADPWGNPYVYVSPGLHGDYDILSLGADGMEGGEENDTDIESWNIR